MTLWKNATQACKTHLKQTPFLVRAVMALCGLTVIGCALDGYSNTSLYPNDVSSVCIRMFDNQTFWRDMEYDLTDALSKRIEAKTPYKVISSDDLADTVISGQITEVNKSVLIRDREVGSALQNEILIQAVVSWKNLKTGKLLIDSQLISAAAQYSESLNQGAGYATNLAANKLAERIIELMETRW
ncbi:MAG: hypothetical protein K9N55_14285 [Phycisphaerae bacterium]|nr:hypothetical protein [Phycisphaerae bacterium]